VDNSAGIVEVGLGIVMRENPDNGGNPRIEVLISRRPATTIYGGWWEIPGGKVDPGETIDQAVVRELFEEVGVDVEITGALASVEHLYDHAHVRLHPRLCRLAVGSPKPRPLHVTECRWVGVDEMEAYTFPEANEPVVGALLRHLASPD
jgi:8-oxo-dGTP diphosphatase